MVALVCQEVWYEGDKLGSLLDMEGLGLGK